MIRAGIVGGSGYVAGELLRCLVHHPEVEVDFIFSHSNAGKPAGALHRDLQHVLLPRFTGEVHPGADVVFLCLGHGHSKAFLERHPFRPETKIIDLSQDFRLSEKACFGGRKFEYGLVEKNKNKIRNAANIANPGCFATAIQLALLPLASGGVLAGDIHVHAITGSTGAGQKPTDTTHFSWRNNNVSIYKPFTHQHLGEIGEQLTELQGCPIGEMHFIPVRGCFTRGIFASVYTHTEETEEQLRDRYRTFYEKEPFTHCVEKAPDLKQVINTNNCFVHVQKKGDKALVISVIDNLLKGAAGQAIQNMNLLYGWEEDSGLGLKASYF